MSPQHLYCILIYFSVFFLEHIKAYYSTDHSTSGIFDIPVDNRYDPNEPQLSSYSYYTNLPANQFYVYEGQRFMFKLSNNLTDMTACNITNQSNKMEMQLLPSLNESTIPEVSYWGAGWDSRECGVQITTTRNTAVWVLTAFNYNITLERQLVMLIGNSFPSTVGDISEELRVGENTSLSFSSDTEDDYCLVNHPSGDKQVTMYGKTCSYPLPQVSDYDNGLWKAYLGIKGVVRELEVDINVTVAKERLSSGWRNSSTSYPGAVDLYCTLENHVGSRPASYCHFIRPGDQVGFHLSDGLGNGNYSYFGSGLKNFDCGITIESPGPDDIGAWKCIMGFESSYVAAFVSYEPMRKQERYGVLEEPASQSMNVINGTDFTLKCTTNTTLRYCFIVAPNGSQYPGDQTLLGIGTCVATINAMNLNQTGVWSCQMGPADAGKEVLQTINVTVTLRSIMAVKEAVTCTLGGHAILRCQSIPSGSSLSYCRFRHPSGSSITLSDQFDSAVEGRFRYYGSGLRDGDCGIRIEPVSLEDGGEWTCSGIAGNNGSMSTATITLHITDSTDVIPGSTLVELGEEVILRMKGRREDQRSCSVQMPNGTMVILNSTDDSPVSYWGEGIPEGYCGVRIKSDALQVPIEGYEMWTLVSNNSHSISTRAVAWVGVKGSNVRRMSVESVEGSHVLSVELGGTVVLDCGQEHSVYCLIVPPGGDPERYSPGPCTKTIDNLSSAHLGSWTCYIGMSTTTREVVKTIVLTAKATTLVTSSNRTQLYTELLCSADYPLKYCRFVDPLGATVTLTEGLHSARLSYKGQGLQEGDCGVRIDSISDKDIGPWMCFVGVFRQGTVYHQVAYLNVEDQKARTSLAVAPSSGELKVVKGSKLTVECKLSTSLAYCWLLHPNGTQLFPEPSSKEELQMGVCRLTIPEAHLEDTGTWVCNMGPLGTSGKVTETRIVVEVKSSSLYATQDRVVATGDTNILCNTVPASTALDYCRFLRPDGLGFFLNQHMSGATQGRYHYHGQGLDKGHCGLMISQVENQDYGKWLCAGVLHGSSLEASSSFVVQQPENVSGSSQSWIIPTVVGTGVLVAVCIAVAAVYILRRRRTSVPRPVPSRPTEPRVSDTSSESSIYDRSQPDQLQEEPATFDLR